MLPSIKTDITGGKRVCTECEGEIPRKAVCLTYRAQGLYGGKKRSVCRDCATTAIDHNLKILDKIRAELVE